LGCDQIALKAAAAPDAPILASGALMVLLHLLALLVFSGPWLHSEVKSRRKEEVPCTLTYWCGSCYYL
jgi:hypothetical protein